MMMFPPPYTPSSNWSTSQPITLMLLSASFAAVNTPLPEPPAATNRTSTPSSINALPTTYHLLRQQSHNIVTTNISVSYVSSCIGR